MKNQYRKKPVVIDAVTWCGKYTDPSEWPEWFNAAMDLATGDITRWDDGTLTIKTLEGVMKAFPGDKIIRGIKGELYPCRMDIFEATYESVEDSATA